MKSLDSVRHISTRNTKTARRAPDSRRSFHIFFSHMNKASYSSAGLTPLIVMIQISLSSILLAYQLFSNGSVFQ